MTERKKRRRGRVALGLFLLTASTTSSLAQLTTTTWNGSEDNDWSNASNWDNGVPTSDVQAVINTLPSAGIGEPDSWQL